MSHTLSILVRTDSLSYIRFNETGEIEAFDENDYNRNDAGSLKEALSPISADVSGLESVIIGLDHSVFTIVPGVLYDRTHWFGYLSSVQPDLSSDEACSIPVLSERFIFQFDIKLRKTLTDYFPGFSMFHLAAAYWIYFMDKHIAEDHLYLILRDYYLYLIGGKENQITLLNRFYAPTENDALYYCLLACKEFKRSPHDVTISITSNRPDINRRFEKYFKKVLEKDPTSENIGETGDVEPADLMDHYCLYYAYNRREIQRSTIPPTD